MVSLMLHSPVSFAFSLAPTAPSLVRQSGRPKGHDHCRGCKRSCRTCPTAGGARGLASTPRSPVGRRGSLNSCFLPEYFGPRKFWFHAFISKLLDFTLTEPATADYVVLTLPDALRRLAPFLK